ncbi:MAG: Ferritin Dps family protein [Deferribacteraceae bacterium]|jgi:bacterioferritin|nr:Ferritin Dps family protein [Deferribacteraceae bacterium]
MHKNSIPLLNQALQEEVRALQQYMYFHFHCDDRGYDLLSKMFKQIAIQEMIHAEKFAERILFLKGEVELKASKDVEKITDVTKMIEMSTKLEEEAVELYNKFAKQCAEHGDSVTKKLFEDIILEEENHFDQFDTEFDNLKDFGDKYLALQSIERSKITSSGNTPAE